MSVFKRYKRKRVKPGSKDYDKGTWYCWVRINGVAKQKSLPDARTKAQAELEERRLLDDAFNKRHGVIDHRVTFAAFADSTYRKYAKQKNVNIKAKETDIDVLSKFFGKRKLISEITAQDCRDVQYRLQNTLTVTKNQRSPSTVNRTMSTASKIFTLACEEGLLERNPMQYVRRLEEPPPRQRLLTAEQKEAFWKEVVKDKFMLRIVMLALNLPVRRGQILAITKEACNLENRKVFVIRSKGRPPRAVPLNNTALRILSDMCAEVESGPLILFKGKPIRDFRTRWSKLLVRANINRSKDPEAEVRPTREENFHFHDLRTELASELVRNNVNPIVVQQLFAHSSMQITQGYMQVDDMLFDAVNSLDESIQSSEVVQ
jgi:integrase